MLTSEAVERVLSDIVAGDIWVSVVMDTGSHSERQRGVFSVDGGVASLSSTLLFDNMPNGRANSLALWDSPSGGLKWADVQIEPRKLNAGDGLRVRSGEMTITMEG